MAINLLIYSILFFIQNNGVNHDLDSIFIEKNSKISIKITNYSVAAEMKTDLGIKNNHLFYKKKIVEFSWNPVFIYCDSYICVSKEQFKTI